jgi:hypothetical protein
VAVGTSPPAEEAAVAIPRAAVEVTRPEAVADIPPVVIAKLQGCAQRPLLHKLM